MSAFVPKKDDLRCRLCLTNEVNELISLYCWCATQDKLVVEMITEMARFDLCKENDGLPQHICDQCLVRLNAACAYLQKSRKAVELSCRIANDGSQCCRTCLRDDVDELISVFCISGSRRTLVADMLRDACGVVRPVGDDGLAQHICGECFVMLCDAYAFRNMVLKSDFVMKKDLRDELEEDIVLEENVAMELEDNLDDESWIELNASAPKRSEGKTRVDLTVELDKNDRNRVAESKRMKLSPNDELDPMIYLDTPQMKVEQLKPLLQTIEDSEHYEKLQFSGIICCCQKLLLNKGEWHKHRNLVHSFPKHQSSSETNCQICHQRFQHESQLERHLQSRSNNLFYRCKICDVMTKNRETLQQHFELTRFHPNLHDSETNRLSFDEKVETDYNSTGECCGCLEPFESSETFLEHIKTAHYPHREDEPRFQCFSCYRSFANKPSLLKHQLTFKISKTYRCKKPKCVFKVVDSLPAIMEHIESDVHQHMPTEFFCCFNGCYKTFESNDALEQHCIDKHAEQRVMNGRFTTNCKTNVCQLCQRHFQTNSAYEAHIQAQYDRKYECATCERKFSTKHAACMHEKQAHSKVKQSLTCDRCGANFASKGSLTQHIKRIHDGSFQELCTFCGKSFFLESELKQHIMNKHLEDKPHKCTQPGCSKSFGNILLLQRHIITHTKERSNVCSHCGLTYRYPSDLRRHINAIHLGNKRFKCQECDARFIRERDLRLHTIRHTNEKLFKCIAKQCDFATNVRKKLDAHWEEHHED